MTRTLVKQQTKSCPVCAFTFFKEASLDAVQIQSPAIYYGIPLPVASATVAVYTASHPGFLRGPPTA